MTWLGTGTFCNLRGVNSLRDAGNWFETPFYMSKYDKNSSRNRAAAYLRMSTKHQQYSTSNQMDVIREYAKRRGLEIVKEYSDASETAN
jgi:predicted site-specific integrase-resolvase